ncbi:MAG: 2-succinyl-6-hydroxy-2,4-cyclohexadiene-1-carboxylate synthase [Candidatus Lambdaproteobacteria bacterium]|nr:2-succinyl-6-hydroxy-2,4-cyclohexadiene-1-carboxylate synthase [Candidatus Lambdaproteobacteria bacterium]
MNAIRLHAECDAPAPGRPVLVLLHGFTGDGTTWEPVREGLRRRGRTVAVELLGHGRSPAPDDVAPYRMEACLDQLEALLARLGIGPAWWVGYSMGGRVALQVGVRKPHLVAGLVLESATPGLESPAERAERVAADEALAAGIGRDGLEAFVERWTALPMFEGLTRLPAGRKAALRAQRLRNAPQGLANSLRGMGTGSMPSAWGALGRLAVPTLLLAGGRDAKFVAIARAMAGLIPGSTLALIPEAGHNVHEEAPEPYLRAVEAFFASRGSAR